MAKKDKDEKKKGKDANLEGEGLDDEDDGSVGSKIIMFFIAVIIIAIWLAILGLLVKMDVGGFGSTVLYPVLKDVPYVNMILPEVTDYEEVDEAYRFDTIDDAVARIKQLEATINSMKNESQDNSSYTAELEAAAKELAEYKANEEEFEKNKEKFYEEVVFSNYAPDIQEYRKYYETIEPANAEVIYKRVIEQLAADDQVADYVKTYSEMKPAQAAAIFNTMTDDLKLVAKILNNMKPDSRASILGAMNTDIAAKLTAMMEP